MLKILGKAILFSICLASLLVAGYYRIWVSEVDSVKINQGKKISYEEIDTSEQRLEETKDVIKVVKDMDGTAGIIGGWIDSLRFAGGFDYAFSFKIKTVEKLNEILGTGSLVEGLENEVSGEVSSDIRGNAVFLISGKANSVPFSVSGQKIAEKNVIMMENVSPEGLLSIGNRGAIESYASDGFSMDASPLIKVPVIVSLPEFFDPLLGESKVEGFKSIIRLLVPGVIMSDSGKSATLTFDANTREVIFSAIDASKEFGVGQKAAQKMAVSELFSHMAGCKITITQTKLSIDFGTAFPFDGTISIKRGPSSIAVSDAFSEKPVDLQELMNSFYEKNGILASYLKNGTALGEIFSQ